MLPLRRGRPPAAGLGDMMVHRSSEADACQLRALFGFNALLHYETLDRQGNVLEENLQCETLQERFEELLLREKDARLHPAYAK